jgi:hypothetical protein
MEVRTDGVRAVTTSALLDSGATTTFINRRLVKEAKFTTYPFDTAIKLYNIDGTPNTAGQITHYAHLRMSIPKKTGHQSKTIFAITDLDDQDIVIGIDWLKRHNPRVNWKEGTIALQCCNYHGYPIYIKRTEEPEYTRHYHELQGTTMKTTWKILAGINKSTNLAIKAKEGQAIRTLEEIPGHYKEYLDVFSKAKSNRMPQHKDWDLEITIKEGKELPEPRKAFPMSPKEYEVLKEFINQELKLGRIRPSKSKTAAPVFFVKKKDGTLRFVQDYRRLNEVTVRNRYPIPLTSELVDQLREAKYFTHLDLRNGYNNIRIKEGTNTN